MNESQPLPPLPTGPGEPFTRVEAVLVGVSLFVGVALLLVMYWVFA